MPSDLILVAGAVPGSDVMVMANAPTGLALPKIGFNDGSIGAGGLFVGARGTPPRQ